MAHDWYKYGAGKTFSIGDWTRDQQFNPPKGKLHKFFKIYADRLIQVSRARNPGRTSLKSLIITFISQKQSLLNIKHPFLTAKRSV